MGVLFVFKWTMFKNFSVLIVNIGRHSLHKQNLFLLIESYKEILRPTEMRTIDLWKERRHKQKQTKKQSYLFVEPLPY